MSGNVTQSEEETTMGQRTRVDVEVLEEALEHWRENQRLLQGPGRMSQAALINAGFDYTASACPCCGYYGGSIESCDQNGVGVCPLSTDEVGSCYRSNHPYHRMVQLLWERRPDELYTKELKPAVDALVAFIEQTLARIRDEVEEEVRDGR